MIDQLVWEYSILDDLEAWKAGRLTTYSLNEVASEYGLDL